MPLHYQTIKVGEDTIYRKDIIDLVSRELGETRGRDVQHGMDQKQLGFVIALDGNRVIGTGGFGRLLMHHDSWFLAFNAVEKDYRRQGIADIITQMRVDCLESIHHAKFIWVASLDYWPRMEKHGFELKFILDHGSDNHGVMLKTVR